MGWAEKLTVLLLDINKRCKGHLNDLAPLGLVEAPSADVGTPIIAAGVSHWSELPLVRQIVVPPTEGRWTLPNLPPA